MVTWKQVTPERYEEMLCVLPPALWTGAGFLVGEAWTHRTCEATKRHDVPAFAAFVHWRDEQFYEAEQPMTVGEFRVVSVIEIIAQVHA